MLTVENAFEAVLTKLLNSDVASEASEMNAALMCDSGNLDGAIHHYRRLIEKQPAKWDLLAKLIPLLRRKGELGKLPEILEEMDDMSSPGKSFCLGLADYYALRTERAMHHLIAAKRSPKWRIPALQTMIRLCLGITF